jgi:dipeptidyl aminopeptidase/acylaminoacyl peptidase
MTLARDASWCAGAVAMSGPISLKGQLDAIRCSPQAADVYRDMMSDIGQHSSLESFLDERSPSEHLSALSCPLLLIHGADDPYCPVEPVRAAARRLVSIAALPSP